MRVALVQHEIAWEDREATLRRVTPMVESAAAGGARLVVLPELFGVGFTMATDRVAEPVGGPTSTFLVEKAVRHGIWIGGSVPELGPGGDSRPHNQFVLAGPDGSTHRYAKLHPFSYAGEDRHYAAGERGITVDVGGVRVTPFVCYDLRFADAFWAAAPGTDVYVVVANWPAARQHHWHSLLVARAIENQAYVVGVNRVGIGGELTYAGGSCVVDPSGEVVASAGDTESVVLADVDAGAVAGTRRRFPFLADRR